MILLAAYAGLRVSEIAAIKGDDVDTVINTITVIGKGDKERQIPLHPILKDLAAVMPARGWWFPTYIGNTKHLAGGPMLGNSVSSSISNVMNRAGIPGTPHALRHWFGSALREAGVDSLVIKELMGHESLATTAIYVDVPLKQRSSAVSLLPIISPVRRAVSTDDRRWVEAVRPVRLVPRVNRAADGWPRLPQRSPSSNCKPHSLPVAGHIGAQRYSAQLNPALGLKPPVSQRRADRLPDGHHAGRIRSIPGHPPVSRIRPHHWVFSRAGLENVLVRALAVVSHTHELRGRGSGIGTLVGRCRSAVARTGGTACGGNER